MKIERADIEPNSGFTRVMDPQDARRQLHVSAALAAVLAVAAAALLVMPRTQQVAANPKPITLTVQAPQLVHVQQAQIKARQGVGNVISQELRVVDPQGGDVPRDGERFAALRLLQLCDPKRGGQSGRSATNDQHINFKSLALGHRLILLSSHRRHPASRACYFCSSAMIAGANSNRSPCTP